MDFWAQHKDFILKVLAGLGVFLVALIARGITYGDDLEVGLRQNRKLAGKIRKMRIARTVQIGTLEEQAARLSANAKAIAADIGWEGDDGLGLRLIERTLGYLRKYRGAPASEVSEAAREAREAIRAELNGGFGQLRLTVQDDLVGEASEKNIRVGAGIGYDQLIQLEADELIKYLLQLETAARLARYCIDARVDAIDELKITTQQARNEPLPDANPEFLQEYPVKIRFRASQKAAMEVLNRLEREPPRVPWREFTADRLQRPADHLGIELTVVPVASNPEVPFQQEKAEKE